MNEDTDVLDFSKPIHLRLLGTRGAAIDIIRRVAAELPSECLSIHERDTQPGLNAYFVHNAHGPIGKFFLEQLPPGGCRLRIPADRGGAGSQDPDGTRFSEFFAAARAELRELGVLRDVRRFHSESALDVARRELQAASDPHAFAAVGNVLRSAVIALANELFDPSMLGEGEVEPVGDAAKEKLDSVIRHLLAGRSDDTKRALRKTIDARWKLIVELVHRKNATRLDAEIVFNETSSLFATLAIATSADLP